MKKRILSVLICLVLLLSVCVMAAQAQVTGYTAYPVSPDDKIRILERTNLTVLANDSNAGAGIVSFDVKEDGSYAFATGNENHCNAFVYDSEGVFQYGYRFSANGAYGIFFLDDNLAIYFVRGDDIAVFDSQGNCIEVLQATIYSGQAMEELFYKTKKEVSGKTYLLENDINIGDSYARLVMVDEAGNRKVLYDNSTDQLVGQILTIVAIVGWFVFVGVMVFRRMIEDEESEDVDLIEKDNGQTPDSAANLPLEGGICILICLFGDYAAVEFEDSGIVLDVTITQLPSGAKPGDRLKYENNKFIAE